MLKRGDQGELVRGWQRELGIAVDGIFGSLTEIATRQWQAQRGLEPDGLVSDAVLAGVGLVKELTLGVDLSQVQGRIDFAKMRAANYRFAIIKVTEGNWLDPRRLGYLRDARSEGILTGVYHFARMGGDPASQMKSLWDGMGPQMPEIGLVLDAETTPASMTAAQVVDWIARFRDEADRYDARSARLYSYWSYLTGLAAALAPGSAAAERVTSMLLWLAHYLWRGEGLPPSHVRPKMPAGPWTRIDMWQCNGGGGPHLDGPPIPGVGVPCDRNVFFGPVTELRERWGGLTPEGQTVDTGGIVHGSHVVEAGLEEFQRH